MEYRKKKKNFSKVDETVNTLLNDMSRHYPKDDFCHLILKPWGRFACKQRFSEKPHSFPSVFRECRLDLLFFVPPWGSLRAWGRMRQLQLLLCFDWTIGHHVGNTLTEMALFGLRGQLTLFCMVARSSTVVASKKKRRTTVMPDGGLELGGLLLSSMARRHDDTYIVRCNSHIKPPILTF